MLLKNRNKNYIKRFLFFQEYKNFIKKIYFVNNCIIMLILKQA
jgi:hypothetical protein